MVRRASCCGRWSTRVRHAGHLRRLRGGAAGIARAVARRAQSPAVGAGAYRLVPGVLAGALPDPCTGPPRRPGRAAPAPRCARTPMRCTTAAMCRMTAAGRCRCPTPTPHAPTCRQQLQTTLDLLAAVDDAAAARDDALYFFRLALLHEDMHHEAALYMAQALGVPIADARWQAAPLPEPPAPLPFDAGRWRLGSAAGDGFAFDNELGAHDVAARPDHDRCPGRALGRVPALRRRRRPMPTRAGGARPVGAGGSSSAATRAALPAARRGAVAAMAPRPLARCSTCAKPPAT